MTHQPLPPSFLIISTLRLGDALLTTPLIRSVRHHYPQSRIDVLVLKGIQGIFEGNPDLNTIIEVPHRAPLRHRITEWKKLWRRYTHALIPVSSDRARFYGFIAAHQRIGFVNPHTSAFSRSLLTQALPFDDEQIHTVPHNLRLLEPIGIPPDYTVVPPTAHSSPFSMGDHPVAVVHPYPKFNYKAWPLENWIALIEKLTQEQGYQVLLTGGNAPDERAFAATIAQHTQAINHAGQLSLAQTADLIKSAQLFIGPDTGITHIAAATGTPTIALFGPTDPVKWGPWPAAYHQPNSPWVKKGSQRQGNVTLIQGPGDCVPCHQEGCDKHADSHSVCLETITVHTVNDIAHHPH